MLIACYDFYEKRSQLMSKVWPDLSKMPDPNDSSRSQYRAIRCKPEEIAPNVIVPGDPMRAKFIAEEWLTDAKLIMVQREFHTYTGTYKNIPISVISTGIGCPSAAMVIQDLGKINCNYLIRVGTAGSCSAEIKPGDNVIGTGAVRDEGLTSKFLPLKYPAVSDIDVTNALLQASQKNSITVHKGVIHTSDAFNSPDLPTDIETAKQAGIKAFEMEASAVMMIGALNNIKTGCILSIDGYVMNISEGNVKPDSKACAEGLSGAIQSALDSFLILNSNDS